MSDRPLDNLGPRASETMKWGWEGNPSRIVDLNGRFTAA